jgi:hypothetical protein
MDEEEVLPVQGEGSCMGERGLRNLGNTCYMNSGLHCLSNTDELSEWVLGKNFTEEINTDNVLGAGGKLINAYSSLIHELWYQNGNTAYAPTRFKNVIGKFQTMFEGYGQHDSQEFVSHLLDGLHEDLNLIKKKPYVEGIEMTGTDDSEIFARKSWVSYCKRNYSKISEMFYGQFKSELKCPVCDRVSITFDPFQLISLGIDTIYSYKLEIYYINSNHTKKAIKLEPKLKSLRQDFGDIYVHELIDKLAEEVGARSEDLYLAFIGFSMRGSMVPRNETLRNVSNHVKDNFYKPKLFLFEKNTQAVETDTPANQTKVINAFGLAINTEIREVERHPTFVKHCFVLPEYPISYVYKQFFLRMYHFMKFNFELNGNNVREDKSNFCQPKKKDMSNERDLAVDNCPEN